MALAMIRILAVAIETMVVHVVVTLLLVLVGAVTVRSTRPLMRAVVVTHARHIGRIVFQITERKGARSAAQQHAERQETPETCRFH